jgi:hypothetical protein
MDREGVHSLLAPQTHDLSKDSDFTAVIGVVIDHHHDRSNWGVFWFPGLRSGHPKITLGIEYKRFNLVEVSSKGFYRIDPKLFAGVDRFRGPVVIGEHTGPILGIAEVVEHVELAVADMLHQLPKAVFSVGRSHVDRVEGEVGDNIEKLR